MRSGGEGGSSGSGSHGDGAAAQLSDGARKRRRRWASPPAPSASPALLSLLPCPACTLLNPLSRTACRLCDSPLPRPPSRPTPALERPPVSLPASAAAAAAAVCLPATLPPLCLLSLPPLPFPSPLSLPLLSPARFSTAVRKGDMALLQLQVSLDQRTEPNLLCAVLWLLLCLGVDVVVSRHCVACSAELHWAEVDYAAYQRRHAEYGERERQRKAGAAVAAPSTRPPLSSLSSPLSPQLLPTALLLYPPRLFCRSLASGDLATDLHRQLSRNEDGERGAAVRGAVASGTLASIAEQQRSPLSISSPLPSPSSSSLSSSAVPAPASAEVAVAVSVQVVVWGLRALVAEEKGHRDEAARGADGQSRGAASRAADRRSSSSFPFLTFGSLSSAIIGLWLQSGGRGHVTVDCEAQTGACTAFLLALRHAATAVIKAEEEVNRFAFGSLRGRTCARFAHRLISFSLALLYSPFSHSLAPLCPLWRKGRTHAMKGANPSPSSSSSPAAEGGEASVSAVDVVDGTSDASALLLSCAESWLHMLSLIRGVSEEKAAVISRHYSSARSLVDAYAQRSAGEAELLLANLQCGQRRIGEQISRRVYHTLYQPSAAAASP